MLEGEGLRDGERSAGKQKAESGLRVEVQRCCQPGGKQREVPPAPKAGGSAPRHKDGSRDPLRARIPSPAGRKSQSPAAEMGNGTRAAMKP